MGDNPDLPADPEPPATPADEPAADVVALPPADAEPDAESPPPSDLTVSVEPLSDAEPVPLRGAPVRLPHLVVACLLVAVVAAATTLISLTGKSGSPVFALAHRPPPRPATATYPVPESDAAYQAALNAAATALTDSLTKLAAAQSPDAVANAAQDFQLTTQTSVSQLQKPPRLDALLANRSLVLALQALQNTELAMLQSDAQSDKVCLGSSATAELSRTPGLAALRDAISQITSEPGMRHFQFAVTLPPVTQDTTRAAANGAIVAGAPGHGLGQLTITNDGTDDVTVNLVPVGATTPMIGVYVAHNASFTLNGVPDGNYQVFLANGTDWDGTARMFSRDCGFDRFDDPLAFTTTSTEYTTWTISATPEPGGTASMSTVDPAQFPH